MMNFKQEINELEMFNCCDDFVFYKGEIPILFSAPHTMRQKKEDGSIKSSEPYTKAIALYLNKYFNVFSIVKINDTGLDSNRDNDDNYKKELMKIVKENNIKLVIDLHGASKERDFDVEFGTLNNLSIDFSTIKELEDAFKENGIKNVLYNAPFKGGAITQYLYGINDIDVVQIEINGKYRNSDNIDLLKKIIDSLVNFIHQYNTYINR